MNQKVDFALINLIAWATPRTIAQISASSIRLARWARRAESFVDWSKLRLRSSSRDKTGMEGTQMAGALDVVSPRALALLMRRSHPADVDIIFEGALKNSGTKDSTVLSMVAEWRSKSNRSPRVERRSSDSEASIFEGRNA